MPITATPAVNPASDMPIWARLALAETTVRFPAVTGWVRVSETTVNVFTATSLITVKK